MCARLLFRPGWLVLPMKYPKSKESVFLAWRRGWGTLWGRQLFFFFGVLELNDCFYFLYFG